MFLKTNLFFEKYQNKTKSFFKRFFLFKQYIKQKDS